MISITRVLIPVFWFSLGLITMYTFSVMRPRIEEKPLERVLLMRPDTTPEPLESLTPIGETPNEQQEVLPTQTATSPASEIVTDSTPLETATVAYVYDGDTVRLTDNRKVRLIGIDSPEMNFGKGDPECYAKQSTARAKALLLNKEVTLEKDAEDTDRYGRLLRYMYTGTGDSHVFVNDTLVREGAALAKRYPPNTTHALQLEASMKSAQSSGLGLWGQCKK